MEQALLEKLAGLNKFNLEQELAADLSRDFDRVLARLEPLRKAELGDTEPLIWAEGVQPVYREDVRAKSVEREEILALAPEQANSCFAVPRVAD